jgi:hypothetical protein
MREEAREWVTRSLEAMNRSKRQSLDDYARRGRDDAGWMEHWLALVLKEPHEPYDPYALYPVVYWLSDPDGRVVCPACFYEHFNPVGNMPCLAEQSLMAGEQLFWPYSKALGPYAFKVLFGKSLVCNHCERVVTADDVHVCELEETVRSHVSRVLRDASGVIPPEVMAEMAEPLFDRAMYAGVFAVCPWHPGHLTIRRGDAPR